MRMSSTVDHHSFASDFKMAANLKLATFFLLAISSRPLLALADCDCEATEQGHDKAKALTLKIIAIFCILVASTAGSSIPSLGRKFPALRPDTDLFFAVKAFAAGVILATAFVHILPDAFDKLGSPCLVDGPWQKFPFAGLIAMLAAIATLVVDTIATGYFQRAHAKSAATVGDEEAADHTHGGHGHAYGVPSVIASSETCNADDEAQLIRHRVISQVLIGACICIRAHASSFATNIKFKLILGHHACTDAGTLLIRSCLVCMHV